MCQDLQIAFGMLLLKVARSSLGKVNKNTILGYSHDRDLS